ncbi:MAG TPA: thioredoxin domain-containing protein [Bacteroidia bacterium]|nr:thioredoxin domain-containing protein [Bacteroidia bacterium]
MANMLLHETSPYLLQHAHNPVNWRAWNDETLALAKSQKKLMLISIGYSACHWCHVMEKQCFENEDAARIMNKHFICIKVDREERPDIDAIYMQALQLMTGQGGWPLNCFTLPDARPIYGGTYFPLEKWMAVLENIQNLYETNFQAMDDYATRLTRGIQQSQLYETPKIVDINHSNLLNQSVEQWNKHFDLVDGGTQRVPKFPMPSNYLFLLYFSQIENNANIFKHVNITLHKMSYGGIFDQIGGGFARYSTDGIWKVPHFEKMLYDNAQLVSLYSLAFQFTNDDNFKNVVEKTMEFVNTTFLGPNNEFYSALDADSEGEEGKYYVWKKNELQELLASEINLFSQYYNINENGYWEHNNYILIRTLNDDDFCIENNINKIQFLETKKDWQQILLHARLNRIAPGLDDKSITSWNALMIKACVDAYHSFKNENYLDTALKCAYFILQFQCKEEGKLYHSYKNGQTSISGFLEDYAFVADCFISIYQKNGDEAWLLKAHEITKFAIAHFYDETDGLFFFKNKNDTALIATQKEVQDNVIPSSNAVIAHVLFQLGIYFEEEKYISISKKMASHFYDEIANYGSAYACWALLLLRFEQPIIQIAIPEMNFKKTLLAVQQPKLINFFPYASRINSKLPFVHDKKQENNYYLCVNQVCGLPLNNQAALINAIQNI